MKKCLKLIASLFVVTALVFMLPVSALAETQAVNSEFQEQTPATSRISYGTFAEVFPDPAMAAFMAGNSFKATTDHITDSDIDGTQYLWIFEPLGIRDITGISLFSKLQYLYVSDNPIDPSLLGDLTSLPNLEALILMSCELTEVPSVLQSLSQLTDLDLSTNKITTIPSWMTSTTFPSLYSAGLRQNAIRELPTFDGPVNFELNIEKNQLVQRVPDDIILRSVQQAATWGPLSFTKDNESDPVELVLEDIIPPIVGQYDTAWGVGAVQNCSWTILQPGGTLVTVPAEEATFLDQINAALSTEYGDFIVTLEIPLPLPSRTFLPQDFIGGSTYTIPITFSAPAPIANTFTVTYDGNNHDSGLVPVDDAVYDEDDMVTVLGNVETPPLARAKHDFAGWNTQRDGSGTGYSTADTFAITDDTTLYAQWKTVGGPGIKTPGEVTPETVQPVPGLPNTGDTVWGFGSFVALAGLGLVGVVIAFKRRVSHR